MEDLNKIKNDMEELQETVYNHKHVGYDKTKTISTTGSTIYSGKVNGDGTAASLPTGWSSTKSGTGTYDITHTLGTANFAPIAISNATTAFCKLNTVSDTTASFVFIDAAGNATDVNSLYFTITLF